MTKYTIGKVDVEKDTIIDIQNGLIDISLYIDALNECIGEIYEIKHSIEGEIERNNAKRTLPPCFYATMEHFNNYLTLVEISQEKLKDAYKKTDSIVSSIDLGEIIYTRM